MKALLSLLLSAAVACAAQFGDDNESGDWLPIPDNYVWPSVIQDAPDFEPKTIPLSSLPKPIQEEIIAHWENGTIPEGVEIFQCDLNNDKRKEVFFSVPAYGGTGGTFYFIFSPGNDGVKNVGSLQGYGVIFRERRNGWYQIEASSRGGGGNYTRYLLTFDGEEYVTTRNEGHDFNRGKVEIRK